VALRGTASLGAEPALAGGQCVAVTLEEQVQHTATVGSDGTFLLLVPPTFEGRLRCALSAASGLYLERYVDLTGAQEGDDRLGLDLSPLSTLVARKLVFDRLDGRLTAPAEAEGLALLDAPGADLARLAEGLDAAFQLLRDDALTVDTEAVMLDLFADGVADLAPLADRAEALATALAASGPHAEAFRATFPPLALTLLHHAGGASALLDAGELSSDAQPVGGIGRFVTALRAAQDAAPGAVLTVSAGNQIAPSKALAVSLETGAEFYDVRAVEQVGYDFIGVGSRDLSLSPSLFAVFANDLEPTVPVVNSVIDGTFEQSWQRLRTEGRLANALLTRAAGRRVLVLGAVDPNLDRRTATRQLRLPDQDTLVATLQARIDEAALAGASVVLLLVDQGSLEADLALGASLSGVDLLLSATPAVLASEDDLLVPGDAVAGPYPTLGTDAAGAPLALVATADRYRYLGRLQAELDSFGVFTQALAPSGPLRILGAPAEDGVEADNTLQTSVLDLLASDLAVLEDATAATLGVDLDAQADALRTGETNFGDLVADAAFAAARSTAFNAGAPSPQVGILDAGSLTSDAVLPAGALTRGALFDLVSSERTLAVFSQVSAAALKALVERGLAEPGSDAFLQLSNLELEADLTQQAQVLAEDGTVATAGARVRRLATPSGVVLVEDGAILTSAPALNVAVTNALFAGRYGLLLPELDGAFVGVDLRQAVDSYLVNNLAGQVTADRFPVEGLGRITVITAD
jgi:5'-nucleotidase